MAKLKTIEWVNDKVRLIDQTKLPEHITHLEIETIEQMYDAIKILSVRGAPAIGIAAAFGLYLGIRDYPDEGTVEDFIKLLDKMADYLAESRPTAVNLVWALKRLEKLAKEKADGSTVEELKELLLKDSIDILNEDNASCRAIGENGFEIMKDYNNLLTHCNAGGLATAEFGTALAPIYIGQEKGKIFNVYSDETRPLLQGSRITALELKEAGIPVTVICDNMAAAVMAQGKIDAVIVGADRIAANGDAANKIGTYGVALAAKAHNIPFYVAAPFSTFDLSLKDGSEIPIEEREAEEVINGFGRRTGPEGVDVFNPAFDVTPNNLIAAIITDKGVLYPPFKDAIEKI